MTEEPHRLILSPGARRALTNLLPEAVAIAAWKFISDPSPPPLGEMERHWKAPFEGHWRARRGEYRVRYEIHEATNTLRILDIDHRRVAHLRAAIADYEAEFGEINAEELEAQLRADRAAVG